MENHVSLRSTDNPLYLHQDFLLCMSNATLRAIYSFRLVLFKKNRVNFNATANESPNFPTTRESTVSLCGTLQIIYIVQVLHCLCTMPSAGFFRTIRMAVIKYAPLLLRRFAHFSGAQRESAILSPLYVSKQFYPLLLLRRC